MCITINAQILVYISTSKGKKMRQISLPSTLRARKSHNFFEYQFPGGDAKKLLLDNLGNQHIRKLVAREIFAVMVADNFPPKLIAHKEFQRSRERYIEHYGKLAEVVERLKNDYRVFAKKDIKFKLNEEQSLWRQANAMIDAFGKEFSDLKHCDNYDTRCALFLEELQRAMEMFDDICQQITIRYQAKNCCKVFIMGADELLAPLSFYVENKDVGILGALARIIRCQIEVCVADDSEDELIQRVTYGVEGPVFRLTTSGDRLNVIVDEASDRHEVRHLEDVAHLLLQGNSIESLNDRIGSSSNHSTVGEDEVGAPVIAYTDFIDARSYYQRFMSMINRGLVENIIYARYGLDTRNTQASSHIRRLAAFLDGLSLVENVLWFNPFFFSTFLACWVADWVTFIVKPYFKNGATNVFFGISKNYGADHSALTANFGSDMPAEGSYWIVFCLFSTAALITGVANLLLQSPEVNRGESSFSRYKFNRLNIYPLHHVVHGINNINLFAERENILWGNVQLSEKRRRLRIIYFYALQPDNNIISRLIAVNTIGRAIGRGYDYHLSNMMRPLRPMPGDPPKELQSQLLEIGQTSSIMSYATAFELWQQGLLNGSRASQILLYLLYCFTFVLSTIAAFQYRRLIVEKLADAFIFLASMISCTKKEMYWRFIDEIGNYDCTVCDYGFVDYVSSLTGQGCLTSLLGSGSSTDYIISKVNQLYSNALHRSDFDFSYLNLGHVSTLFWTLGNWKQLFSLLNQFPSTCFSHIDISVMTPPYLVLSDEQWLAVSELFVGRDLGIMVFDHQQIGVNGMKAIASGINNSITMSNMSFVNCSLENDSVLVLLPILSKMPQLYKVDFSGNPINDFTFLQVFVYLLQLSHTVFELILRKTAAGKAGIEGAFNLLALNGSSLVKLDVSQNSLISTDMRLIGSGLNASINLSTFSMVGCDIGDASLVILAPYLQYISQLDISDNYISSAGIAAISSVISLGFLQRLSVSYNGMMCDAFMQVLQATVNVTSRLQALDFSYNQLDEACIQAAEFLLKNITSLTAINLSGMDIGSVNAIKTLIASLQNLVFIDLSDTQLTEASAIILFNLLPRAIEYLNVADNRLMNAVGTPLANALQRTQLSVLNITNCFVTAYGFQKIIEVVRQSQLRILSASANVIGDDNARELARQLVRLPSTNHPYAQFIGADGQHNDVMRAIHDAQPATQLRTIELNNASIANRGARALCQVLPSALMQVTDILLQANDFDASEVGIRGCPNEQNQGVALPLVPESLVVMLASMITPLVINDPDTAIISNFNMICIGAVLLSMLSAAFVAHRRYCYQSGLFRSNSQSNTNNQLQDLENSGVTNTR